MNLSRLPSLTYIKNKNKSITILIMEKKRKNLMVLPLKNNKK